ncbi:hypothetical protein NDU88_005991 [Pleurodeles waltl]|uniref:Uncharacterized protein n=1 Tax=Pleurodeles waltl TaxID=8319 RepID=A0AAV7PQ45_PLEWA|nr:hypothetical protein NDU88_005991 [Pleurodeles waltl]
MCASVHAGASSPTLIITGCVSGSKEGGGCLQEQLRPPRDRLCCSARRLGAHSCGPEHQTKAKQTVRNRLLPSSGARCTGDSVVPQGYGKEPSSGRKANREEQAPSFQRLPGAPATLQYPRATGRNPPLGVHPQAWDARRQPSPQCFICSSASKCRSPGLVSGPRTFFSFSDFETDLEPGGKGRKKKNRNLWKKSCRIGMKRKWTVM